jgi:hypothetical protein
MHEPLLNVIEYAWLRAPCKITYSHVGTDSFNYQTYHNITSNRICKSSTIQKRKIVTIRKSENVTNVSYKCEIEKHEKHDSFCVILWPDFVVHSHFIFPRECENMNNDKVLKSYLYVTIT